MKFYLRNFLFILVLAFISIFFWAAFTSYNNNYANLTPANTSVSSKQDESDSHNEAITKVTNENRVTTARSSERRSSQKRVRNILCKINGEYKINCLKLNIAKESSIFVPFSFLHKYFEVNGKIVTTNDQDEYFEWSHSYSKIFYPDNPYDPTGKFLWFANFNVEMRDRVKCVSAIGNVPLSMQWFPSGHFYPTQIAQYGLSHFNKNISEPAARSVGLIENGIPSDNIKQVPFSNISAASGYLIANNAIFYLNNINETFMIFQIELSVTRDSKIGFHLVNPSTQEIFKVVYACTDKHINLSRSKNQTVIYGLGRDAEKRGWFTLTRDLHVDLFKGNLFSSRKRINLYLSRVKFVGNVRVRNLLLKTSGHEEFALSAGDWLVHNQNHLGGWDIKVKRKLSSGLLVLDQGWHSAMGQGQAMSLLTRLYHTTNRIEYLNASKRALDLFEIESFKNGVKAMLFDKYPWYEEYPTVPSIYVLNGFIYSLFGLYDLSKTCDDHHCHKAGQLFEEGLRSLEAVLPLFDSGSGSFYDLRHLTLGVAPNVARWDYHSTHINQLLYLNTIVRNDLFQSTAERWTLYMKGHRAPHN